MRIREQLMAPGRWTLELDWDRVPRSILAQLRDAVATWDSTNHRYDPGLNGLVVVFDGETDNPTLAQARYSGPLFRQDGYATFSGVGPAGLLGTDNGIGYHLDNAVEPNVWDSQTFTYTDLADAVDYVLGDAVAWGQRWPNPDITAGTVSNTGLTSGSFSFGFTMSARELLDHACYYTGGEWRVNPDGTLDAAARGTLFATESNVLFTDEPFPPSQSTPRVLRAAVDGFAVDTVDVSDVAWVAPQSGTGYTYKGYDSDAIGATMYGNGNTTRMRWFDIPNLANTQTAADNYAAALTAVFQHPLAAYNVTVTADNIRTLIQPGDVALVWSPDLGIESSNVVTAAGADTFPHRIRATAIDWNATRGSGVWLYLSATTWVDLTPYVLWPQAGARIELSTDTVLSQRRMLLTGGPRLGTDEQFRPFPYGGQINPANRRNYSNFGW